MKSFIDYGQNSRISEAEYGSALRVEQSQIDCLVGLIDGVIDDIDREGFARLSRGKDECAVGGVVVSTRDGRSIRNGVIDRDATGAAAGASDLDEGLAAEHPLIDAVSGRAELQDAPGVVVDDRQHGGIRSAESSPTGGVAQSEIHGLVGLIERVFDDGYNESFAGYSRRETECAGLGGVVGASSGGSIAR